MSPVISHYTQPFTTTMTALAALISFKLQLLLIVTSSFTLLEVNTVHLYSRVAACQRSFWSLPHTLTQSEWLTYMEWSPRSASWFKVNPQNLIHNLTHAEVAFHPCSSIPTWKYTLWNYSAHGINTSFSLWHHHRDNGFNNAHVLFYIFCGVGNLNMRP